MTLGCLLRSPYHSNTAQTISHTNSRVSHQIYSNRTTLSPYCAMEYARVSPQELYSLWATTPELRTQRRKGDSAPRPRNKFFLYKCILGKYLRLEGGHPRLKGGHLKLKVEDYKKAWEEFKKLHKDQWKTTFDQLDKEERLRHSQEYPNYEFHPAPSKRRRRLPITKKATQYRPTESPSQAMSTSSLSNSFSAGPSQGHCPPQHYNQTISTYSPIPFLSPNHDTSFSSSPSLSDSLSLPITPPLTSYHIGPLPSALPLQELGLGLDHAMRSHSLSQEAAPLVGHTSMLQSHEAAGATSTDEWYLGLYQPSPHRPQTILGAPYVASPSCPYVFSGANSTNACTGAPSRYPALDSPPKRSPPIIPRVRTPTDSGVLLSKGLDYLAEFGLLAQGVSEVSPRRGI